MMFTALSIISLMAVLRQFFLLAPTTSEVDRKRLKKDTYSIAVPLALISMFALWVVISANKSRETFKRAISQSEEIEIIEGRVTEIERLMIMPHATSRTATGTYWVYQSIRIDGNKFLLGRGTANPGFRHYNYRFPPIIEGDQMRVEHYRGRAVRIEKSC